MPIPGASSATTSTPAGTPLIAGPPWTGPCAGLAPTGTICHSDRSSQYASDAYQAALKKAKLCCSITDGPDCDQKALVKRVNGILKDEFLFVLPDDLT